MHKSFYTEDLGTTPFYCEWCGEIRWETKYWLEDGWDELPTSIECLCESCFMKGYQNG